MVRTRGKKNSPNSDETPKENEAAEIALTDETTTDSVMENLEEPVAGSESEEKVEIPIDEAKTEKDVETNIQEKGKHQVTAVQEVDENTPMAETNGEILAENTPMSKINGENLTEEDQNTSEDDETDDLEEVIWEDEENLEEEDNENSDEDDGDENSEEEDAENAINEDQISNKKENSEIKEIEKDDAIKSDKPTNPEKVEEPLKVDQTSKRKIRKGKKVGPTDEPKPETSSGRKKGKKRVESMGMIFMCSSKTKNDCYKYGVLGLPASKKDTVEKIYTGMRLFLYDVDLKLMYGIYKAAGPGGYNIEAKAFKEKFPSQVRFKVLDDCLPLPEEKFKDVIKENYFTKKKFHCQLNSEQVKKLCKLFAFSTKRLKSRNRKAEKHLPVNRDRIRRPREDERPLASRDRIKRRRTNEEKPLAPPGGRTRERRAYEEKPPTRTRRHRLDHDRSPTYHKRPRNLSPVPPLVHTVPLPVPQSGTTVVPSYGYGRTLEVVSYRRDPYLESRDDPYRDRPDPLPIRRNPYRDESLERRAPYRDGHDSYLDVSRDGRGPYLERRVDPYRDRRDPYLERPVSYVDGRDAYRSSYRDDLHSEAYDTYRRETISDLRADSYRRDDVLERCDIQPSNLETRRDIGSQDYYVTYRERPAYAEPVYPAEYSSRAGIEHHYRL